MFTSFTYTIGRVLTKDARPCGTAVKYFTFKILGFEPFLLES